MKGERVERERVEGEGETEERGNGGGGGARLGWARACKGLARGSQGRGLRGVEASKDGHCCLPAECWPAGLLPFACSCLPAHSYRTATCLLMPVCSCPPCRLPRRCEEGGDCGLGRAPRKRHPGVCVGGGQHEYMARTQSHAAI